VSSPIKPASSPADRGSYMLDRFNQRFTFYPGVPAILRAAHDKGITIGLASRTHAPDLAKDMLKGLSIPPPDDDPDAKPLRAIDVFAHQQIFPGSKTNHFQRIQDATRRAGSEVQFTDMLFFDDESRNRNVETELGVTFWLVRNGVTRDEVDKGVREWRKRSGIKPQESVKG